MLKKLLINNYAIIDHLEMEPGGQLNTVTGETGAGKSIILGAISLILGERADTSVLINKEEKCVVEAYFDVKDNAAFRAALKSEDLDDEPVCIVRREISTAGKSRAFVNDTPVTLNILNNLTSLLVDLHQQFGHLALEDDHFQLDVLDALAQNGTIKQQYSELFNSYRNKRQELSVLQQKQADWQKEADYKQFLYDELAELSLQEDEIEKADAQLKQLANAERIISVLQGAKFVLDEGEQPLLNELKKVMQQLQSIEDVMPDVKGLGERMTSALVELKDIAGELEGLESSVNLDEGLMQQLQDRIDMGYKLLKKHNLQSTNELLSLQSQLEGELKISLDLDEAIQKLIKETDSIYKEVLAAAKTLSKKRSGVVTDTEKRINELLALVGMPNAKLKISIEQLSEPASSGMDKVQFMLDANKSGQFLPVYKAASGGEMSRIMLCIKSMTARAMELPTLIFDEVDTGISGEAAKQVGILLKELGEYHQVVCITHQPQVAAKGARHFYVYKEEDGKGRIKTNVRVLEEKERVLAIAKMIGGEQPSEAAMQNAKELVA